MPQRPRDEWHGRNKGSAYIRWYPGDMLSDGFVSALTPIEEHCYRRLLDFNARDGFIPSDPSRLATLCKVTADQFAEIWTILEPKFQSMNGKNLQLTNARTKYELDRQKKLSNSASERGKKGGRPPKRKKTKGKPVKLQLNGSLGTEKLTQSDPDPDPDPYKKKEEEDRLRWDATAIRKEDGIKGDFIGDRGRIREYVRSRFEDDLGPQWIAAVWESIIDWCRTDGVEEIPKKKDYNKFVMGWYRRQAEKRRSWSKK